MVTLHAYILRELLKAFGLTVVALAALFTMGGGLYNILKFEGVTAGDLFTVLPMLLPVTITVTMPIAALFAATITYGRLAADNEFVAARAAGVNVHRLFLSAILLSVFVTLATVFSVNVLIPDFMGKIVQFAKGNVREFAYHRLLQRGYIHQHEPGKDRYTLTAQRVLNVARQQLVEKGFAPPGDGMSYFWVEQPTFLMSDESGELKRFSVAEGGLVQFDTRGNDVKFTLYVKNARDYEVGKRVVQIQAQKIGPYAREIPFSPKPSMVDLETLRNWQVDPSLVPKLRTKIDEFLELLRCQVFYTETARHLDDRQPLVLFDSDGARYEINPQSFSAARKELTLDSVKIAKHPAQRGNSQGPTLPTLYEAPRASLSARPSADGETLVELELEETRDQPVLEFNPRAGDYHSPREKESLRLVGLRLPQYVLDRVKPCTPAAVIDPAVQLPIGAELEEKRAELQQRAERLRRKVSGVFHFRFSFASSALVTILMGAMLGLIFRGSRTLAAFGLACIPFGATAILIAMGKQMTESEGATAFGPLLIWGGLGLVAVADILILRLGVRR